MCTRYCAKHFVGIIYYLSPIYRREIGGTGRLTNFPQIIEDDGAGIHMDVVSQDIEEASQF